MPVTASNGFPSLKKTDGTQTNEVFLVANLLNSKEILESVDSNYVLASGLHHFGSSFLDPMLYSMCGTVHTNELCRIMLSQYYSSSMCSTLLLDLLRTFAGYLQLIPINTSISANLNNKKLASWLCKISPGASFLSANAFLI